MLPELNVLAKKNMDINVFGGLNDTYYVPVGSFQEMKNLTSDYYPVMGTRPNRRIASYNVDIDGIISYHPGGGDQTDRLYTNYVWTIRSRNLYKNDIPATGWDPSYITSGKKTIIPYGANLIIMPDKVMYNTVEHTMKRLSFELHIVSGGTIYMSNENGEPYIILPENGATANMLIDNNHTIREHDTLIAQYLQTLENYFASFVNERTAEYESGDPFTLKKCQLITGSKALAISGNDVSSYEVYLGEKDDEKGIRIKKYSPSLAMWKEPELYITYWFTDQTITDTLKNSIKKGDYIKIDFLNQNNVVIDDNSPGVKESYKRMFKHFGEYVEVVNVLTSGSQIGLVFKNTGVDFTNVLVDTPGRIKWGNYSINNQGEYTREDDGIKKKISIYSGTLRLGAPWNGSTASICESIKIYKDMPDMDFITVSNNRIWGCSNDKHEIYACKLGDPTNWHTYKGMASDSYTVTIGSQGYFTGAFTYRGKPYFTKENLIVCMYGTKPANYQVEELYMQGIEKGSSLSPAYLNGCMYFKTRDGIVRFDGSTTLVSEELGEKKQFKNAIGCADSKKYYVSMEEDGTRYLYAYDSRKKVWHKEDNLNVSEMVCYDNSVYGLIGRGLMRLSGKAQNASMEETQEGKIQWYGITGKIENLSMEHKYVQNIGLVYQLAKDGEFRVFIQYDNESGWEKAFERIGTKDESADNVTIKPRRCERFRLKFEGTGQCYIWAVRLNITGGSDKKYGNI